MWGIYSTVELRIRIFGEDIKIKLPGSGKSMSEFMYLELIADGAQLLDNRVIHLELSEDRINFR